MNIQRYIATPYLIFVVVSCSSSQISEVERQENKDNLTKYRDCVGLICEVEGSRAASIEDALSKYPPSCMLERMSLYSIMKRAIGKGGIFSSSLTQYDSLARDYCLSSYKVGLAEFCQEIEESINKQIEIGNDSAFIEIEYDTNCF